MSEAENLEYDEEEEQSIDEIREEIVEQVTKKEITQMVAAVQKQDDVIATAKENKRAAFAKLTNKGCSKKALQRYVVMQTAPPASNAREQATIAALEEITGQADLFAVK